MFPRLTASILFCIALLMQVLSPVSSGVAMDVAQGDVPTPGIILCHLIQGSEVFAKPNAAGPADSNQAPAPRESRHDHHSCSLCQIGSNAAFLQCNLAPVAGPVVAWASIACIGRAEPVVTARSFNCAQARAPPFFA
jgi:hypothetical protein